jgi:hypothetical protein
MQKTGDFSPGLGEGGGLETVVGSKEKVGIAQVLISRTLRGRGEVAEWPKAAVC